MNEITCDECGGTVKIKGEDEPTELQEEGWLQLDGRLFCVECQIVDDRTGFDDDDDEGAWPY